MTAETPARTARPERFDPGSYEQKWRERWEADELDIAPRRRPAPEALRPDDVSVPVRRPAHRPLVRRRPVRTSSPACSACAGYNVMFPMGFDAFGLPAENAAIDRGIHPAEWTKREHRADAQPVPARWARCSTGRARSSTSDPDYYRWTQWLFLQFYEAGLAYRAIGAVDWCPKDQVVLAREQVRAPSGAASAAARRSSSATSSSGSSGSPTTPTSCWTSTGSTGPSRSG